MLRQQTHSQACHATHEEATPDHSQLQDSCHLNRCHGKRNRARLSFRDPRGKQLAEDYSARKQQDLTDSGTWKTCQEIHLTSKLDDKPQSRYWNFKHETPIESMFLQRRKICLWDFPCKTRESKLFAEVLSLTNELTQVKSQLKSLQLNDTQDSQKETKENSAESLHQTHENPIDSIVRQDDIIENPSSVIHKSKIQMLQSKLEEKSLECEMQRKQIEDLKMETRRNVTTLREVSVLESKFRQCMESLAIAESQVSKASQCFDRIETTELIVSQLDKTSSEIARCFELENRRVDSISYEVMSSVDKIDMTMRSLRCSILTKQNILYDQSEKHRTALDEMAALHAKEIEVLKDESSRSQSQLSTMLWELETYVNKCNTQEVALSHMHRQCIKLQAELSETSKENANLKDELKQVSEQLNQAQTRCFEMEQGLGEERLEIINYNREIQNLGDLEDDESYDMGEDVERSLTCFDSSCDSTRHLSHRDILAMLAGPSTVDSLGCQIEACITQSEETMKTLESFPAGSQPVALPDAKSTALTETRDGSCEFVEVILRKIRKTEDMCCGTLRVMEELKEQIHPKSGDDVLEQGEAEQDGSLEELIMKQVRELNKLMRLAKRAYETTTLSECSDETLDTVSGDGASGCPSEWSHRRFMTGIEDCPRRG
eukprot:747096-Hanusia_phi.AAC.5